MKIHGFVRLVAGVVVSASLLVGAEANSADAFAAEARKALQSGDYKKSAKMWERAVRLDSTNADYREGLGKAYEREAEISSFPQVYTAKARQSLVHALALQPDQKEAMADLIELNQQPIGLCEGDLNEASRLIDRLQQVDPAAAQRERDYWNDAKHEADRPGQKFLCGPVKVTRVVANRILPNPRVQPQPAPVSRPTESVVAEAGTGIAVGGTN